MYARLALVSDCFKLFILRIDTVYKYSFCKTCVIYCLFTSEEQCAKVFLWILFAICGVVLLFLGVYLYCHVSMGSTCTSYKHQIKYMWDRTKYYYYHYTQSKLRKFVWFRTGKCHVESALEIDTWIQDLKVTCGFRMKK